LLIVALLRALASREVAAIVSTPTVKRASSGRMSARPEAETWTSTSSRSTPRGSGADFEQAPRARGRKRAGNRLRMVASPIIGAI
jgi:hypothetical protein